MFQDSNLKHPLVATMRVWYPIGKSAKICEPQIGAKLLESTGFMHDGLNLKQRDGEPSRTECGQ